MPTDGNKAAEDTQGEKPLQYIVAYLKWTEFFGELKMAMKHIGTFFNVNGI